MCLTPGTGGQCSLYDDGTATFPASPSNTTDVAGACDAGYIKTGGLPPTRTCNIDLTWSATSNPCTRMSLLRSFEGKRAVG